MRPPRSEANCTDSCTSLRAGLHRLLHGAVTVHCTAGWWPQLVEAIIGHTSRGRWRRPGVGNDLHGLAQLPGDAAQLLSLRRRVTGRVSHLAIQEAVDGTNVVWMHHVTVDEYLAGRHPAD